MYRAWDAPTKQAFTAMLQGAVPNKDRYAVCDGVYYHRKTWDGSATTLEFFSNFASGHNEAQSNWLNTAGLPPEEAFWMQGFAIGFEVNNSLAGDEVAGADIITEHATNGTGFPYANELLAAYQCGRVIGTYGSREFVNDYGLNKFPVPWGVTGALVGATAVGATNLAVTGAILNNGTAQKDNYHKFRPWIEVLPQTKVKVTIQFDSARTLTANPVIGCYLIGKKFRIAGR
jgi:hypothetical protein